MEVLTECSLIEGKSSSSDVSPGVVSPSFSFSLPSGKPGKLSDGTNYSKLINQAVRRKWRTPEEKETWYGKLTGARRRKAAKLYEQQGGQCFFCRKPTWFREEDKGELSRNKMATLEHLIPQSKGGTDHMSNLVMACYGCNNLRGDMRVSKFIKLRSDPEAWRLHCRAIAKRAEPKKLKDKAKRADRQAKIVWQLGVFLYLRPEWLSEVEAIRVEWNNRIDHIRQRAAERKSRTPLDPEDLALAQS